MLNPASLALYLGAAALVFVVPGFFLAESSRFLRTRLGRGERLLPAWLLSALIFGLVYAAALGFRLSLDAALRLHLGLTACCAGLFLLRREGMRRESRSPSPGLSRGMTPLPDERSARPALMVIAAVTLVMAWDGGSLGYIHDSLDFVAFVRRMLIENRVDLASGAYQDLGDLAPDPRRGSFHLAAALIGRLSGIDPVDLWRFSPVALVPLALWAFFASTRRLLGSTSIATWATVAFVVATLFDRDHFLQNLGYASRIGWAYSWVSLWAVATWVDVSRADQTPPPDWRPFHPAAPSRTLLILALLAAPTLVGVHILSAAQSLLALGALCWSWAFFLREPPRLRRTLWWLPIWGALLLAPVVAVQAGRTYSAANPLFDHPQGLLYLFGDWAVLGPEALTKWYGWPGLLGILCGLLALRRVSWDRGAAYLFGSTLVTIAIVLNPIAVSLIEGVKAHSLLFRVLYVAPIFAALGWAAGWAIDRRRDRRAAAILLVLGLAFALQANTAIRFWRAEAFQKTSFRENAPLMAALAYLDRIEPRPVTVVSDPITSYQIPAYSRHFAICPYNQHSSPADARTIERTYDALAVLNAEVDPATTWEILGRYRARYVLLNHTWTRYFRSYLSFVSPLTFERERAKFARDPDRYEPVYTQGGISIFRLHDLPAPPDTARTDRFQRVSPAESLPRTASELASRLGLRRAEVPPVEGLELIGIDWPNSQAPRFVRGEYIRLATYWRQTQPVALPVEAFIRAEARIDLPGLEHPLFGRARRAWHERRSGEVIRYGRMHQPLETWYPPFLWEPGGVYFDEYWLPIPKDARLGRYQVRLHLAVTPYAPNLRLRDLLAFEDSFTGAVIGEVEVVP